MTSTETLQDWLALEHEAVWLYPVVGARFAAVAAPARTSYGAHRNVRDALLARQRAFRQAPGLVADGRDMGTVVFPDAPAKVFLTASAEERARRRHKQLMEKGIDTTLAALLEEIRGRDARDAGRSVAPLKAADDALCIDSTGMSIEQVVAAVLDHVRRHGSHQHLSF